MNCRTVGNHLNMTTSAEILIDRQEQKERIVRTLSRLLHPKPFKPLFVYTDEGISFQIRDRNGEVLLWSNTPQPVEEIKGLSDEVMEQRLRDSLERNRQIFC